MNCYENERIIENAVITLMSENRQTDRLEEFITDEVYKML